MLAALVFMLLLFDEPPHPNASPASANIISLLIMSSLLLNADHPFITNGWRYCYLFERSPQLPVDRLTAVVGAPIVLEVVGVLVRTRANTDDGVAVLDAFFVSVST